MKNKFYAGTMGDTCNGFNTAFMREVFDVAKRLLSPREYEIFYLHAVEGWTFAELGQYRSFTTPARARGSADQCSFALRVETT